METNELTMTLPVPMVREANEVERLEDAVIVADEERYEKSFITANSVPVSMESLAADCIIPCSQRTTRSVSVTKVLSVRYMMPSESSTMANRWTSRLFAVHILSEGVHQRLSTRKPVNCNHRIRLCTMNVWHSALTFLLLVRRYAEIR